MLFVRPGELRQAKWTDIDLEAGEWRYVTSKSKTAHVVPLSAQAVAVLEELWPLTKRSDYVFPVVPSADRPMSENTVNAALRNLGFDGETIVGHGSRAMARTVLDEVLGFRPTTSSTSLRMPCVIHWGEPTTARRTCQSARR